MATPAGTVTVEASPAGVDGTVAAVLSPERPPAPPEIPPQWPLTAQERQVVRLLGGGVSNRQLAAAVCLSEHTVEWHLRQIYQKLGVHSRVEVLARLLRKVYWPVREAAPESTPDIGRGR